MASNERTKETERADSATAARAAGATTPSAERAAGPDERTSGAGAGAYTADNASGPMAATPLERARISCDMNARYHSCREAFLDTLHRWFMFGIIAFGAAALIDVLPERWDWLKAVFAAGTAILGALDLTFDLSNRARMHGLMKRRYFELLADVIEGKKSLEEMQATISRYNADEEPAYHALIGTCWNAAQKMVYGDTAMVFKIPAHHRVFKNWLRFPSSSYAPEIPPNSSAK